MRDFWQTYKTAVYGWLVTALLIFGLFGAAQAFQSAYRNDNYVACTANSNRVQAIIDFTNRQQANVEKNTTLSAVDKANSIASYNTLNQQLNSFKVTCVK